MGKPLTPGSCAADRRPGSRPALAPPNFVNIPGPLRRRITEFIDTNIWVYAHLEEPHDPRCPVAWQLLDELAAPYVSAQVIAE